MADIPDELDRRLDGIGRNDPDAAEELIRDCIYAIGYCPSTVAHYLYMLQDDDADLRARTKGMEIRPTTGTPEVC